jgi:hypothetical protein
LATKITYLSNQISLIQPWLFYKIHALWSI